MIFAWDDVNREHLAKHNVPPEDAEDIVANAQSPYPMEVGDEKLVVWGQTIYGRYLQVIYVLKPPHEVEYEHLCVEDWLEVESGEITEIVRVIHAMDMTAMMKKRFRKRRRQP
jgi:uncharacterized DUF497 family protein